MASLSYPARPWRKAGARQRPRRAPSCLEDGGDLGTPGAKQRCETATVRNAGGAGFYTAVPDMNREEELEQSHLRRGGVCFLARAMSLRPAGPAPKGAWRLGPCSSGLHLPAPGRLHQPGHAGVIPPPPDPAAQRRRVQPCSTQCQQELPGAGLLPRAAEIQPECPSGQAPALDAVCNAQTSRTALGHQIHHREWFSGCLHPHFVSEVLQGSFLLMPCNSLGAIWVFRWNLLKRNMKLIEGNRQISKRN